MKKLVAVMTQDDCISAVILLEDGRVVNKIMHNSNPMFQAVLTSGDEEFVIKHMMGWNEKLDKGQGQLQVENGVIIWDGVVVENALTNRILRMIEQGFNADPLKAFLSNLMLNPSNTAIQELYLFLEANLLGVTKDGHFLAYKSVNENFSSIHDGKTDNSVGALLSMPRNMVDDNRSNTCSRGYHFASLDYCKNHFCGDKIVALKINPRDVVSIPHDYNNQKGRACAYEVVAELTDFVKEGRDVLSENVITDVGSWDDSATLAQNITQPRDCKGRFVKA